MGAVMFFTVLLILTICSEESTAKNIPSLSLTSLSIYSFDRSLEGFEEQSSVREGSEESSFQEHSPVSTEQFDINGNENYNTNHMQVPAPLSKVHTEIE